MKDLRITGRLGLWFLLLGALSWVFPASGWCQGSLGGLTGHVADPSGAAVPEVSVKVTNLDTGEERSVVSTTDGTYLAASLAPGRYRVTVSKSGFKTISKEPVIVVPRLFQSSILLSPSVRSPSRSPLPAGKLSFRRARLKLARSCLKKRCLTFPSPWEVLPQPAPPAGARSKTLSISLRV